MAEPTSPPPITIASTRAIRPSPAARGADHNPRGVRPEGTGAATRRGSGAGRGIDQLEYGAAAGGLGRCILSAAPFRRAENVALLIHQQGSGRGRAVQALRLIRRAEAIEHGLAAADGGNLENRALVGVAAFGRGAVEVAAGEVHCQPGGGGLAVGARRAAGTEAVEHGLVLARIDLEDDPGIVGAACRCGAVKIAGLIHDQPAGGLLAVGAWRAAGAEAVEHGLAAARLYLVDGALTVAAAERGGPV